MNQEIEKLIKKAERSLAAARRMFEAGDYDFSASRVYYSMFYLAEAALLTKGLSFSSHSSVISGFFEHFIKTDVLPKELHKTLHHAFLLRQEADYMTTSNITKETVEDLLRKADIFTKGLINLLRRI